MLHSRYIYSSSLNGVFALWSGVASNLDVIIKKAFIVGPLVNHF